MVEVWAEGELAPDFLEKGFFYQAQRSMQAYGLPLRYVGLAGVDLLPGPNVTVHSVRATVVQRLQARGGAAYTCKAEGCARVVAEADHQQSLVYALNGSDGAEPGLVVVHCAYTGP